MLNQIVDDLHEVGELNDAWAAGRTGASPEPVYTGSGHPRTTPTRRGASVAAMAAAVLLVVGAGWFALARPHDTDPDALAVGDPLEIPWTEGIPAHTPTWPADHPEIITGTLPDGRGWRVEVEAGRWELCIQIGDERGCGAPSGYAQVVWDGESDHALAVGIVAPGPTHEDAPDVRLTPPADRVELEAVDGTTIVAEVVGERIWATPIAAGTELRRTLRYGWTGVAEMWMSGEPADVVRPG